MTHSTPLQDILNRIEGTSYERMQSIDSLISWGFELQQWMAFSGSQQALCKLTLQEARRRAMVNLVASLKANGAEMAISLQKQYVDDLCAQENYNYELAQRCNRACVHALDFTRSCLSTLKTELAQTR